MLFTASAYKPAQVTSSQTRNGPEFILIVVSTFADKIPEGKQREYRCAGAAKGRNNPVVIHA
jgi:hypothetical protein